MHKLKTSLHNETCCALDMLDEVVHAWHADVHFDSSCVRRHQQVISIVPTDWSGRCSSQIVCSLSQSSSVMIRARAHRKGAQPPGETMSISTAMRSAGRCSSVVASSCDHGSG